jgi:signal transduction histidine kinase/ActR/RegA family two-component response regulator
MDSAHVVGDRDGVDLTARSATSLRAWLLGTEGALAVVLTVTFVGLIVSTDRLRTASDLRAHSEQVLAAANRAETLLLDLETGERGFVITDTRPFLAPWRSALVAFPAATAQLRAFVRGNHNQEVLAQAIQRAGAAYIRGWSLPLVATEERDPPAARRLVLTGRGKREVDALRVRFGVFIANEQALAAKRTADADASASRALAFAIGGPAITLSLLVLFALVLTRSIARPLKRLSDATARLAADDLSGRVTPGGPRELSELAQAFNAMASSLEHGRAELLQARADADSASLAKSEFLSRMSHELRTPLNAVIGFGQLLELEELDEGQRDNVGHILKAGRHLLELINEVLEIARIEAGQLAISPEPVPLADTAREVLALAEPLAASHHVALNIDLAGLVDDGHVQADRQRLRQVLLNLLANAIKYNHVAGRVTVSFESVPGIGIRTLVADTGIGIGAEQLPRVFEPFDRLGAEANGVEGTGLGLALSKRLVEAMGGAITVNSELGRGSTFVVELGAAEPPDDADAVRQAPPALATIGLGSPSERHQVLYIEDNLSNFKLVERILEREPSVELLAAMQGRLGLDLAAEHHPSLIVLDLHLPDMRGEDVLRRLKADPDTRHLPVVVLSADASRRQTERLLALGASDYLTKPLDVQRFIDVIAANLKTKEQA